MRDYACTKVNGLHMSMHCGKCNNVQPFSFDAPSETYQDVINVFRQMGWTLELAEGTGRILNAICPGHGGR